VNKAILVLEDDVSFRKQVLRPVLERHGYEVHEAGRVREAEQLLQERSFDLWIVDGLLPDGSGLDFIVGQRKLGNTTPAVFLSAFWKDGGSQRALAQAGVIEVLHKPADLEELAVRIARMIADHRA
jgi:DNA-binding response OmpR family regulator